MALLFKCFHLPSADLYIKFYSSYIIPRIEYCSEMYSTNSKSNRDTLESIQRKFSKFLFRRIHPNLLIPSYTDRLKIFKLNTLSSRLLKRDLLTLYKIKFHMIHSDFAPVFSPRSTNRFIVHPINTSLYRSSFFHRTLTLWNDHVRSFDLTSLRSFKSSLSKLSL